MSGSADRPSGVASGDHVRLFERWLHLRVPKQTPADEVASAVQRAIADATDTVEREGSAVASASTEADLLLRTRETLQAHAEQLMRAIGGVKRSRPGLSSTTGPVPLPVRLLQRYDGGLTRLADVDRRAILFRLELGLSWPEVARLLKKPHPDAARLTVSRAVARLAREMVR